MMMNDDDMYVLTSFLSFYSVRANKVPKQQRSCQRKENPTKTLFSIHFTLHVFVHPEKNNSDF